MIEIGVHIVGIAAETALEQQGIGVLRGPAVAVTAEVITVPIWVVIASACTPAT